jgi:hypothetical protein
METALADPPASVPLVGFLVELAVFGSVTVALFAAGHRVLAVAFVLLVAALWIGSVGIVLWGTRTAAKRRPP